MAGLIGAGLAKYDPVEQWQVIEIRCSFRIVATSDGTMRQGEVEEIEKKLNTAEPQSYVWYGPDGKKNELRINFGGGGVSIEGVPDALPAGSGEANSDGA